MYINSSLVDCFFLAFLNNSLFKLYQREWIKSRDRVWLDFSFSLDRKTIFRLCCAMFNRVVSMRGRVQIKFMWFTAKHGLGWAGSGRAGLLAFVLYSTAQEQQEWCNPSNSTFVFKWKPKRKKWAYMDITLCYVTSRNRNGRKIWKGGRVYMRFQCQQRGGEGVGGR